MLTPPCPDEIHVYIAPINAEIQHLTQHLTYLNTDEQQRASRFLVPKDQHLFIIAHGMLRWLLGNYLQTTPAAVSLVESQYKKPMLAPMHNSALKFNLSHSGERAVIAVTNDNEVGIDIEIMQPQSRLAIAERYYSANEVRLLKSLRPQEQTVMFYRIWSKKEAIVKANGMGLAEQLSAFSVDLSEEQASIVLKDHQWSVYPLSLDTAYAAAVATATPVSKITIWEFSDHTLQLKSEYHP